MMGCANLLIVTHLEYSPFVWFIFYIQLHLLNPKTLLKKIHNKGKKNTLDLSVKICGA